MAIVKTKYTTSKKAAKANIRYIQHRKGKDEKKKQRTLFGYDSAMNRHQAYDMIDEAKKGTKFYKIIISPDPKREDANKDLNMWDLTAKTIQELEKRLHQDIQFVGVVHNDHKPHRHVHILALVNSKLITKDLQVMRCAATQSSLFQRRERDAVAEIKQEQGMKQELDLSL